MANSAILLLITAGTLISGTVCAPGAQDDSVVLAARALGFVRNHTDDIVRVALVCNPNVKESAEEAANIRSTIDHGMTVGRLHFTVIDVSLDHLDSAANANVIWLTRGLNQADYERAGVVATRAHALSVSSDLDCAQTGACVLGVQSAPSVRIILNSSAALKAGISFEPAFRMMVTEK